MESGLSIAVGRIIAAAGICAEYVVGGRGGDTEEPVLPGGPGFVYRAGIL